MSENIWRHCIRVTRVTRLSQVELLSLRCLRRLPACVSICRCDRDFDVFAQSKPKTTDDPILSLPAGCHHQWGVNRMIRCNRYHYRPRPRSIVRLSVPQADLQQTMAGLRWMTLQLYSLCRRLLSMPPRLSAVVAVSWHRLLKLVAKRPCCPRQKPSRQRPPFRYRWCCRNIPAVPPCSRLPALPVTCLVEVFPSLREAPPLGRYLRHRTR